MYGLTCATAGRGEEAIQACERAVELDPECLIARVAHYSALHLSRRYEEAVAALEAGLAISGRIPLAMAGLATAFADWGKAKDANAIYSELMVRARRSYVQPSVLAIAAAAAGIEKNAVCHACEAFEIRDPGCYIFSRHLPQSARLRAYPRFQESVTSMGVVLWN